MVKLTRDYYAQIKKIDNTYLRSLSVINEPECIAQATTGYLTPQSFMFFDFKGYILTVNNIPLLYHISRHSSNKKINLNIKPDRFPLKYTTTLPNRDIINKYHNHKKYWWLEHDATDAKFRDEVRRRRLRKK